VDCDGLAVGDEETERVRHVHNTQGELYVTDTLGLLVTDGETVAVHTAPVPWEVEGINTQSLLKRG